MKILLASLLGILLSSVAAAQTPILTNADLSRKVPPIARATPAQLESLRAHQFTAYPQYDGPTVTIITSSDGARTIPWEDTYEGKRSIEESRYEAARQAFIWSQGIPLYLAPGVQIRPGVSDCPIPPSRPQIAVRRR